MSPGKVLKIAILMVVAVSLLAGCATFKKVAGTMGVKIPTGPTATPIQPADIDARLAGIDAEAFFGKEIVYNRYDLPAFDQYFMQVNVVAGKFAALEHTLSCVNAMVDSGELRGLIDGGLLTSVLESQPMSPEDQQRFTMALVTGNVNVLKGMLGDNASGVKDKALEAFKIQAPNVYHLTQVMPVLVDLAMNLPNDVQQLIAAGQTMITNAPSQLAGPQAILLPKILKDAKNSLTTLKGITDSIGGVLGQLKQLIG